MFIHVADAGSFSGAARRLGVARTTIMRRITALEAELGLTLIQRAGNSVILTEIGHRLVEEWRSIQRRLERVEADARVAAGRLSGTLRLWLPVMGTGAGIVSAVADFSKAHEGIEVQIRVGRDPQALRSGAFDVAMQIGYQANPELLARTMFRIRMVLVASRAYIEAHGAPASLAALADHRCVQERDSADRVVPWRTAAGALIRQPPVAVSANAVGHVFGLALCGAGVAQVPEALAYGALSDGRLVRVLPEVFTEEPVSFVYLPDPSPMTRAFLDFMSERARSRGGPPMMEGLWV